MAQDIVLRIVDRSGDESLSRREIITTASETASVIHPAFSLVSGVKKAVSLGAVVTANTVIVDLVSGTPTILKLYKDVTNYVQFKELAALVGASGITALYLEANANCVVWVYIAGATS